MDWKEIINEGRLAVEEHPQHDLAVAFRCRLFAALDAIYRPQSVARAYRVNVTSLAIRKVLPLWESHFLADRMPHRMLEIAQQLITNRISPNAADKEVGEFWTRCDDLSITFKDKQHVVMVGYGAAQVVREALSEAHFGCDGVSEASSELDVEPYDHDAVFCAAVAFADGAPWQKTSNPERRLEFWKSWLGAVQAELSE